MLAAYEVINAHKLPVIFHTGHSGIGSGMYCGGKLRPEYPTPCIFDDRVVNFGDMQIVMAHPSFPWQDEALSVATHKPNVIDLSGWESEVFSEATGAIRQYAAQGSRAVRLHHPLITPERWMKDFEEAGRSNPR